MRPGAASSLLIVENDTVDWNLSSVNARTLWLDRRPTLRSLAKDPSDGTKLPVLEINEVGTGLRFNRKATSAPFVQQTRLKTRT